MTICFDQRTKSCSSDTERLIREKRCHTKWRWFREEREGIFFHAPVVNYWTCFLLPKTLICLHVSNSAACKTSVCNIMVLMVFHILFQKILLGAKLKSEQPGSRAGAVGMRLWQLGLLGLAGGCWGLLFSCAQLQSKGQRAQAGTQQVPHRREEKLCYF